MKDFTNERFTDKEQMDIRIKKIDRTEREKIEIFCHEVDENIREIVSFLKTRQGQIAAHADDKQYAIPLTDIYYIEAVDNKVFLYCRDQVYETGQKLYELEKALGGKQFLRVSKSVIVHLMKIKSLQPALNGRFRALLQNGEEIIISRKYVPELKNILSGGSDER